MAGRLIVRMLVGAALLVPVTLMAQAPDSLSIGPVDAERVKVTVKRGEGSGDIVCDAQSAEVTYSSAGTVVSVKGPATLVDGARKPVTVSSVRLTFTDGKLSGYEYRIDGISLRDLLAR